MKKTVAIVLVAIMVISLNAPVLSIFKWMRAKECLPIYLITSNKIDEVSMEKVSKEITIEPLHIQLVHLSNDMIKNNKEETDTLENTTIDEVPDDKETSSAASELPYDEAVLIAKVIYHEANNQSVYGRRLVADTIFNRVDNPYFPNDIWSVISQPGQYDLLDDLPDCPVTDENLQIAYEEFEHRTNDIVYFFRTKHYHTFGTPVLNEQDHWFSTL